MQFAFFLFSFIFFINSSLLSFHFCVYFFINSLIFYAFVSFIFILLLLLLLLIIIIIIIIISSSSSSSMELPDSLLLSVPIIYCSCQVFQTASSVHTELMNVSLCRSANTGASKSRGPNQKILCAFILISLTVTSISRFSYSNGL